MTALTVQAATQWIHDHAELLLAVLAALLVVLNILLTRRVLRLRARLRQVRTAAEDSARAAALASPGGIDPEAVIEVIRRGVPPTLDNVYAAMQRRERVSPTAPPA